MSGLIFLPPMPDKAGLFVSWLNDPEVVRYSEQRHKTHTIESQLDYWHSAITAHPNAVFLILLPGSQKVIGSVSINRDIHNGVADIGILIGDKTEWGRGYGYEAWRLTCEMAFAAGVRKIEAGCMSINKPMLHIFKKSGMEYEGNRRRHFQVNGTAADLVMYGMFK